MPAKNPRLTITMQPGLHSLLRRLSELTGQSQSSLIFDLLDGAQPVLSRVIHLLEASNNAKQQLKGKLALDMKAAQDRIEQQLGLALEHFEPEDTYSLMKEIEANAVPRQARHDFGHSLRQHEIAPRSPKRPPLSNRGVRSLTKPESKPKHQAKK